MKNTCRTRTTWSFLMSDDLTTDNAESIQSEASDDAVEVAEPGDQDNDANMDQGDQDNNAYHNTVDTVLGENSTSKSSS